MMMPLFPMRRPSMAALPGALPKAPDQMDPMNQGQRRRGGLFGRARSLLGNDGDPTTPNAWDWLVLGPTAPDILQERAQGRDLFGMRVRQAKQEEADSQNQMRRQQQRDQMVKEYIATLPPEQQVRARTAYAVDPEAFAESMAQQMTGGGWEVGQGYSHAFRTRPDGTVEMGDPLPLRPRAPIQGYMVPYDGEDWEYAE